MKKNFLSFKTALAIIAIAVTGVIYSGCSKDDDFLSDENTQISATDDVDLKTAIVAGVTYSAQLPRHYEGTYPYYVKAVLDFSTEQLPTTIDRDTITNSSNLSASCILTFYNQVAYKTNGGAAKGCPCFILCENYEAACYTAYDTNAYGYGDLSSLTLSDVINANLTYATDDEDDYNLPFLTTVHPSGYFFNTNELKQSAAYAYYDSLLVIGRQYHVECNGSYTTPIWIIKDNYNSYWAFCVDPYKTTGSTEYSTFNYKYLGQYE